MAKIVHAALRLWLFSSPPKSLFAAKLTQADNLSIGSGWLCFGGRGVLEDGVVSTLVGSFLVIMNGLLTAQVIEMPLAEHNEMVKAFCV